MNVFLDSSALAKRYVNEKGSDRVEEILTTASALGLSVICFSEVVFGMCRLRREAKISSAQYSQMKGALVQDVEGAVMIHLTDQVIARAVGLLENWPLRSSDALHIACAAAWASDLFVSADDRQCKAARGHGLRVEEVGRN